MRIQNNHADLAAAIIFRDNIPSDTRTIMITLAKKKKHYYGYLFLYLINFLDSCGRLPVLDLDAHYYLGW